MSVVAAALPSQSARIGGRPDLSCSPTDRLLAFYTGTGKDVFGCDFNQVLEFEHTTTQGTPALEKIHNYIQWIFPNPLPSNAAKETSPLLTPAILAQMKTNAIAQERVRKAFAMMLRFYGIGYDETTETFDPLRNDRGRHSWIAARGGFNHNYQRMTRIFIFLNAMGMKEQALGFYHALAALDATYHFNVKSFRLWGKQAGVTAPRVATKPVSVLGSIATIWIVVGGILTVLGLLSQHYGGLDSGAVAWCYYLGIPILGLSFLIKMQTCLSS